MDNVATWAESDRADLMREAGTRGSEMRSAVSPSRQTGMGRKFEGGGGDTDP